MNRLVVCLVVLASMVGVSDASALVIQGGGCPPLNPDCSGGSPPEPGGPKPPTEGKPGLPDDSKPGSGGAPATPGEDPGVKDDPQWPGPLTDPPRMDPGDGNGQGRDPQDGGSGRDGNDANGDGFYSESEWKDCVRRIKQAHPGATSGYIGAFCDVPDGPDSEAPGAGGGSGPASGGGDLGLGAYAAQQGGESSPSMNGAAQAGGAGLPGVATTVDGAGKPGKPLVPGNDLGGLFTPPGDEGPNGNGTGGSKKDPDCAAVEKSAPCISVAQSGLGTWTKPAFLLSNGVKVTIDYTGLEKGIVRTTAEKDGVLLAARTWNVGFTCKVPDLPLLVPVGGCDIGVQSLQKPGGGQDVRYLAPYVMRVGKGGVLDAGFQIDLYSCEKFYPVDPSRPTPSVFAVLGLC